MSEEQRNLLADMMASYQERQQGLVDLHRRMKEVTVTATSPRQEVSVTVSHLGGLEGIKFGGSSHRRLAPQELSDLIMQTFRDAKEQADNAAAELIAPVLPAGLNARDLMAGRIDLGQLAPPDGPHIPDVLRRQMEV